MTRLVSMTSYEQIQLVVLSRLYIYCSGWEICSLELLGPMIEYQLSCWHLYSNGRKIASDRSRDNHGKVLDAIFEKLGRN